MHYFLGLEVWQFLDKIFLKKGKYTVAILKRFGMLDCEAINTPMVTNLKLLNDDSSERVDVTLYRHYWLIDVFDKYKTKYMFFCEHLESVYGGS